MQKPLTLTLNVPDKNGKLTKRTFSQALVPLSKAVEAANMREKFEDLTKFNSVDWINENVDFVADVFHSNEVTHDSIMAGLDSRDFPVITGIINEILGINPN